MATGSVDDAGRPRRSRQEQLPAGASAAGRGREHYAFEAVIGLGGLLDIARRTPEPTESFSIDVEVTVLWARMRGRQTKLLAVIRPVMLRRAQLWTPLLGPTPDLPG
jgi:hypothetical protein